MALARRTSAMSEAAASVAASADIAVEEPVVTNDNRMFLSTGSTLLNLALSDRYDGGWMMGRFANLIGDSSSGKTFLALTSLAEACYDSRFDNYSIIFDDVEAANTFDIAGLFGRLADRMEAPYYDEDDNPVYSNTIEEWYANVMRLIKSGKPFIYVLDSVDALTSNAELDRAEDYIDAQDKGKEVKGSYKMDKAKLLSEALRVITNELAKTNSLIIAISQTRDNVDAATSRFTPKVRAGGRALKFYATHEMWVSHLQNITNTRYERKTGDRSKIKVSKNKVTGKVREVPITLYYSYGIDDIGENLTFLIETKKLPSVTAQTFDAKDICGITGTKASIIAAVDKDREAQKRLAMAAGKVWNEIEKAVQVTRPSRYE